MLKVLQETVVTQVLRENRVILAHRAFRENRAIQDYRGLKARKVLQAVKVSRD